MYRSKAIAKTEYPKLDKVLKALKMLDNDERDGREYYSIVRHLAEVSPRLRGHILTRRTGVLAYEWDLSLVDKTYPNMEIAKERLTPAIEKILETQLDTILYGLNGYYLNWESSEFGLMPTLEQIQAINLDYDDENVYLVNDDNVKTALEPDKILFEVDNYKLRGGALRGVILQEILAHELLIDWSDLAKRMKGIITASFDSEVLQSQIAALGLDETAILKAYQDIDNALENPTAGNWIKTLKAFEIKLNSLVESGSSNAYKILMDELNNSVAISILGQANTSQLPNNGGSRAALQVLNLIRSDILYYDMIRVKRLINEVIRRDYKMNNNSKLITPIKFNFIYDDNTDINTYANTFEILARMNVPVKKDEFYQKLALSKPLEDDEVMFINSSAAPIL